MKRIFRLLPEYAPHLIGEVQHMYNGLCRFNKGIAKIEEKIVIAIMAVITLVMVAQVSMRYVFKDPLSWSQELSLFLLIYLCFFSADLVYYKGSHISVDYFVGLMNKKVRNTVLAIINLLIILALCVVFYHTVILIDKQAGHVIAGSLPIDKSYWILPFAIVQPLMILKALEKIMKLLAGAFSKDTTRGEKK
jgi:C4-dicarboxylate transporter DctQ subunit